jgi:hypothetical protein
MGKNGKNCRRGKMHRTEEMKNKRENIRNKTRTNFSSFYTELSFHTDTPNTSHCYMLHDEGFK